MDLLLLGMGTVKLSSVIHKLCEKQQVGRFVVFFLHICKKKPMDFYAENYSPLQREPDLTDYPIFRKSEWEEHKGHFDSIVRFIVYRYNPKSPVFLKRNSEKRDEEARVKAELKPDMFKLFSDGDKLFLSLIVGYLQHIRDHEWSAYTMANIAYIETMRNITEYRTLDLKAKDKVTTTKELGDMIKSLASMAEQLKTMEATLFDHEKGQDTALSLQLQRFAPKVIDGLTVDLIRFPCEYFAEKTRDTFCNETPKKRNKVSTKES